MASEFAKAIPKAARTRALRYFVGGTAGAVGLGCGGTYAAYRYFLNFEQLRREEAARGGKPAPKPAGLAGGPSMWPIVAGASTCFSVGALGGLAMSAKGGTKKVASSEGAVLGAQAFVIATGLVAGLGVAIVYTIRGALGVTTIREFGELVRCASFSPVFDSVGLILPQLLGFLVLSFGCLCGTHRGGPMVLDDDGWDGATCSSHFSHICLIFSLISLTIFSCFTGADSRHDFVDGRKVASNLVACDAWVYLDRLLVLIGLRLDSGLEIMYDLLHYNGTLGAEQQEGAAAAAAQPKLLTGPQPVVLLHGLNGNRATMRDVIAPSLTEAGHAVLLMDQRGATGGTTTTRGQRKVWWRWQPGSAGNAADTEGVSVKVLADDTLKLMDKLHLPGATQTPSRRLFVSFSGTDL